MFERQLQKMLKTEEIVVLIVRRYPLVLVGPGLVAAVFLLAPFFFMVPLFRWGWPGVAVFGAGICIGLLLGVRLLVVHFLNVFVITEDRIIDIDQRGLFDRTISETTYDKIQDVSTRVRGIFHTLFHFGSVIIQTAGTQANIELHSVKDPERIQQAIISVQREYHSATDSTDLAEETE